MSGMQASLLHFIESMQYPFLIPLGAALIGGEEMIILVTILSVATGVPSFATVVIWSYIGTFFKDCCVFLFGKHGLAFIESFGSMRDRFDAIARFIDRVTGRNYFLALLITKFLYGARIITIFYVAREKMTLPTFFLYNTVVTGLWIMVTCGIGWLAGRGVVNITKFFGDITYGLGIVALAALAFYGIRIWLNRIIVEEEKQL